MCVCVCVCVCVFGVDVMGKLAYLSALTSEICLLFCVPFLHSR